MIIIIIIIIIVIIIIVTGVGVGVLLLLLQSERGYVGKRWRRHGAGTGVHVNEAGLQT